MKVAVSSWVLQIAGLFLFCLPAVAQLKVTYPASRAIFQRDNANTSTIYISGTYSQPVTKVEARLVKMAEGQGIDTDWVTVQQNPQGGVFQGPLKALGGWYQLEVRGWFGNTLVGQDIIQRIGVGEVFVITGQSNAQGLFDRGATGASDDRVNCVAYDNSETNSLADPPAMKFQQLSADALIGPRGQSAWCWGTLGDLITRQYNVPVLFINTAWAGTSIRNWVESADNKPTKNIWRMGTPDEDFPKGMPYGNLLIALRYFSSLHGLRAVLWQQGETDNVPLHVNRQEYKALMQHLVDKTRSDTKRYPSWVLARSSLTVEGNGQPVSSSDVVAAQNDVINTFNNNVYAGPFLDNVQVPRPDGIHFGGQGLNLLGERWFASMDARFFTSSIPLLPLPSPALSIACAATNQSLTLSLPEEVKDAFGTPFRFADVTWSNGQKGRTISVSTPGTYYAIAKDERNTTFISPSITITAPLQPATPTISPAGQQQACADSAFTFSTNSPATNAVIWNGGTSGQKLVTKTAGEYTARAVSVYGCSSGVSAPVSLVIRPKLSTPAIEQVGPYSLQATLPADATPASGFDWRVGSQPAGGNTSVIKVVQNGKYAARSKAVFTIGSNSLTCYSNFSGEADYITIDDEKGIAVYPNPSENGLVRVETRDNLTNAELSVYTLTGQLVYATTVAVFDNRQTVDLSGLSAGSYIVRVKAGEFNVSRRVMVK